jgi:hypothetical protein
MLTAEPGANLCMRKESAMKDQTATPSPSKQTQGVEEPMVMGMAKKMCARRDATIIPER